MFKTVTIPGPLSSFARMAALSPDLAPEELLPSLARNVVTNGYEASGNEALQAQHGSLIRYVGQARELQAMTNKDRKIVIPNCDSDETGKLLKTLGYRMRGSCGADIVLETVNATRAFLTIDSGFPLTELEQDLRANRRFELSFASTQVPVLYSAEYWLCVGTVRRISLTRFSPMLRCAVCISGYHAWTALQPKRYVKSVARQAQDLCSRAGFFWQHVSDSKWRAGCSWFAQVVGFLGRSAAKQSGSIFRQAHHR